jgi:alpha-D-ribose 1-methylphosphonate 5-triphosphate synthase subunit PhnL
MEAEELNPLNAARVITGQEKPGGEKLSSSGPLPLNDLDSLKASGSRPTEVSPDTESMVWAVGLQKTFILHLCGPAIINALEDVSLSVSKGRCLAITGPSGAGKSSLLRCLYGNYRLNGGEIYIRHLGRILALSKCSPRLILEIRALTMSYVSQFLRVIPRVETLDVVCEPLMALGWAEDEAKDKAKELLTKLRVPERLWTLPPATFSGGEKQRVNLARGLLKPSPILMLDEPTASLDKDNKLVVCDLINEAKSKGAAILGVFHDKSVFSKVADSVFEAEKISRPAEAALGGH